MCTMLIVLVIDRRCTNFSFSLTWQHPSGVCRFPTTATNRNQPKLNNKRLKLAVFITIVSKTANSNYYRPRPPLITEVPTAPINAGEGLQAEANRILYSTTFRCPSCTREVTLQHSINGCIIQRFSTLVADINRLYRDLRQQQHLQRRAQALQTRHNNIFHYGGQPK